MSDCVTMIGPKPADKAIIDVDEGAVFQRPDGVVFVVVEVYDDGSGDVAGDSISLDNPIFPLDGGYIDEIRPAELARCQYLGTLDELAAKAAAR